MGTDPMQKAGLDSGMFELYADDLMIADSQFEAAIGFRSDRPFMGFVQVNLADSGKWDGCLQYYLDGVITHVETANKPAIAVFSSLNGADHKICRVTGN